jgi:hypothetical protein
MRFLVPNDELGRGHMLTVRHVDSERNELARIDGKIETSSGEIAGLAVPVNMVINMSNTRFEQPGEYSIDIIMDGDFQRTIGLRVSQASGP